MKLPSPPLLVISDRRQARHSVETVAAAAFEAGCRWFSLREKDLPLDERRTLLSTLITLGRRYGATVTVHDDLEAALETGAAGLHLPSGGNPAAARARFPDGLIGGSAHSAEEATQLLSAGADYVTVSPVFTTASKPGYGPALGLEGLAGVVTQAPGPVIALGGITAQSAGLCLAAGARGVAIMGEVMRAADPQAAVAAILGAISGNNPGGELRRPKNATR